MISQSFLQKSTATLRQQSSRSAQRWISSTATTASTLDGDSSVSGSKMAAAAVAAVAMVAGYATTEQPAVACEQTQQQPPTTKMLSTSIYPNAAAATTTDTTTKIEVRTTPGKSKMPIYTAQQVAVNNGENGKPIWMSYGGNVYDVTNFVANHPGGSEKILQAAGSSVEPFWHLYRQHFASDLPMKLMEQMLIGELLDKDQEKVDLKMEILEETTADPYALEPIEERNEALIVHSEQPMNAEVPERLLTKDYLTPPDVFYIRHHHPVPFLTADDVENFELELDLGDYGGGKKKISLQDIQKMPKVEVTATLQCSGNRRGGYNDFERTSGTSWGQGAISTAKWGGVRLRDLIKHMGLEDEFEAQEKGKLEHVRFHAMDGMMASIGIEKAMNPYGDVILCYEMNGKPLPRDHGYPLRVIVPGYAAVRNVKWVQKIELSTEEAEGPWQRGLNYKVLPPGVKDAKQVDLSKIPSMMELSVQSGITSIVPQKKSATAPKPGDVILVKASGWAYSGGGRNIVRVDVTGDGAQTWQAANLVSGQDQKQGRAWAWTFWECTLPAKVQPDGSVQVHSKGVDLAFNSQPDSAKHNWNPRGLTNNSWYRKTISVQ